MLQVIRVESQRQRGNALGPFREVSTMPSRRSREFLKLQVAQHAPAYLLGLVLLFAACPQNLAAQDQETSAEAPSGPPYMQQTPEQLQQLVAPIALYPDSLVAQILAAST